MKPATGTEIHKTCGEPTVQKSDGHDETLSYCPMCEVICEGDTEVKPAIWIKEGGEDE